MKLSQKVETSVLRNASGRALRLDYCLLARAEGPRLQLTGPYGLEIVLTGHKHVRREQCSNLTGNYRHALALIHFFAQNRVLSRAMLEDLDL